MAGRRDGEILVFRQSLSAELSWGRLQRGRLGRNFDLDLIAGDADLERVDLDLGIVAPFAVVDAEPPGVPRAGHDTIFQIAAGQ
jgi:hypothetical protein